MNPFINRMNYTEQEIHQNFAGNLAFLRLTRTPPLSQKALARLLNLSCYAINHYESGGTMPSAYALYRISIYFGIPMETLLTTDLQTKGKEN
ncbi:MAG: helix-turn-helix transcriptional regulator [Hespellia sp.]|nr:helix-turn-helix transcriptional regulator [Hespellia sp.]